jgi:aspartate carbamoyltransferase catalytic subunit
MGQKGLPIKEIFSEKEIPDDADVWYWNRLQKERFPDLETYEKDKGKFVLTKKLLKRKGHDDLIILDPLPRIEEIDKDVDSDPRALYLTNQPKNGLYIRMALLGLVMGEM